jgi:hypothetical protein
VRSRPAVLAEAILGLGGLALFVLYFGIHCFRYPWVGDLLRHSASVASLYRDFRHPAHEAMPVPGTQSEVHTPYIVAIAAIGRTLGVTPYRALQLTGVANLIFYAWAVWFFFRTFSIVKGSLLPPAVFLLVSLFLRNRLFWWASETSFAAVRLIQAYPSFFAWGAALTIFALTERYLRRPRAAPLAVIALLVWSLVLSHSLTASWVVGIVGIRALFALFSGAERRPTLVLGAAVVAAVALTLAWPYFDVAGSRRLLSMPEGSEFGDHPFRDMAGLYALALPVAILFARLRKHLFWIAGFVATFLALQGLRTLGFDYANRYAFFQAFFVQSLVSDAAGLAAAVALGQTERLPEDVTVTPSLRALGAVYLAAILLLTATAPTAREESRQGRPLLSFRELVSRPSTHDAYYAQLGEVGRRLNRSDVVMMPVEHQAWNVAAISGARVVASLFAYRVPDYSVRTRDVARFFSPGTTAAARRDIVARYGVTKILLTPKILDREHELASELGPPIARSHSLVLFEAGRYRRGSVVLKRLGEGDRVADRPAVVQLRHGRRVPVAHETAFVDPDRAAAVVPDLREGVRDEEDRLSRLAEVFDPRTALHLKALVPDRERLVDEQNVGLDVGGDRERETGRHAGRISADRRVDELLELRPLDDTRRPAAHLGPREAEQRALEHDVLPPGQLPVKAQTELEKRRCATHHDDAASARRHHAGDEAQQRALACSVAADDADRLAGPHLERHLAQRFELVEVEAAFQPPDRVLLQRPDPLPRDPVAHRHLLDGDRGAHPFWKAKRSARFAK